MTMLRPVGLLKVLIEIGTIEGRKKLHKLVYLLKASGDRLDYDYDLHYYGPYSHSLAQDIDVLSASELLVEQPVGQTHKISPTEKGKLVCVKLAAGLTFNKDLAKVLLASNSPVLELASTVVYLAESGVPEGELNQIIPTLKPNLKRYYGEAKGLLNHLALTLPPQLSAAVQGAANRLPA